MPVSKGPLLRLQQLAIILRSCSSSVSLSDDLQKFLISVKAELENVTNVRPQDPDNYDWKLKFKCSSCQEEHSGWVIINASEEVEQSNSRGVANLVMRCKGCKNEGTTNILTDTLRAYDADENGQFAPLVHVECRGLEPIAWGPSDGWAAEGTESGTRFDEIPLGEGEEWADYDEKAALPVGITDMEGKIGRA
ncbi:hypothetical protein HDU90_005462 [Geranomyces variabilis]|nr:hypothetical protein HDU90_005462 [Geranomyces variabilis]